MFDVPDVPLEEGASEDLHTDHSIRVRKMSKASLIAEAGTMKHKMSHFPHNPFCEVCVRAHLRQRRYARRSEPSDSGLQPPTKPWQQLSSDDIIIAKSADDSTRISASGHTVVHCILDTYSGCGIGVPCKHKLADVHYKNFRMFAGPHVRDPTVVVRSDAAKDLTTAIEAIGWLSEPSLENKWPHNANHERYHGTFKSVCRASACQSGAPSNAWHAITIHAGVALCVTQPAKIYPWERDASGEPLEAHRHKLNSTAWEVQQGGAPFTGPLQPFGRLCYYWDRKAHPMEPTASPGLFIGWRLESGLRYRDALLVLDYEVARKGSWREDRFQALSQKEVFFPRDPICSSGKRATTNYAGPVASRRSGSGAPFAVRARRGRSRRPTCLG